MKVGKAAIKLTYLPMTWQLIQKVLRNLKMTTENNKLTSFGDKNNVQKSIVFLKTSTKPLKIKFKIFYLQQHQKIGGNQFDKRVKKQYINTIREIK